MTPQTTKYKTHFLVIARGSCAELRTQIYIGMEIGYVTSESGKQWLAETREISKMINGLITSINQTPQADGFF